MITAGFRHYHRGIDSGWPDIFIIPGKRKVLKETLQDLYHAEKIFFDKRIPPALP
jgi:hypothetical protein